jgi:hypothetical protein
LKKEQAKRGKSGNKRKREGDKNGKFSNKREKKTRKKKENKERILKLITN